jgi:Lysophospholipase L1 and related esterases
MTLAAAFGAAAFLAAGCESTRAMAAGTRVVAGGGLAVRVGSGENTETLRVAPPELFHIATNFPAPANLPDEAREGYSWTGAAGFMPRYDSEDGSIILGGAFRQTLPESVEIMSTNGALLFIEGRDFALNTEWGQFAAIDGRLGASALQVKAALAMQRIDLLQEDAAGKRSVKQGISRLVCPRIPAPDEGCRAVAGIYVAPWRRGAVWTVTQDDIFPIRQRAAADAAAGSKGGRKRAAAGIAKTRAKLEGGTPVTVAFVGDSITLGAEAGRWWSDDSATFRGRVTRGLRERFPGAAVTEVQAFQGGKGIEFVAETFHEAVAPSCPDLIILGIGVNDAHEKTPGTDVPAVAPAAFEALFKKILVDSAEIGAEVIVLTSMQTNPFDANGDAARWSAYLRIQRSLAAKHNAVLADTYAAWMDQALDGIPPFSQLHNWINHPGADGHKLFADTILRAFD